MKTRPWIAIGTFVCVLGANFGIGIDTETSTQGLLIIPAGVTFGIARGTIYTLLSLICLVWITHQSSRNSHLTTVAQRLTISNILNIGWIVATNYDLIGLSVFVIAALAFAVRKTLRLIVVDHAHLKYAGLLKAGFGLYLGRLTVATFGLSVVIGAGVINQSLASSPVVNLVGLISAFVAGWFLIRSTTPWVIGTIVLGLTMSGVALWSQELIVLALVARGAGIALTIPAYQAATNPYIVK